MGELNFLFLFVVSVMVMTPMGRMFEAGPGGPRSPEEQVSEISR